jgi:hypothetical protein
MQLLIQSWDQFIEFLKPSIHLHKEFRVKSVQDKVQFYLHYIQLSIYLYIYIYIYLCNISLLTRLVKIS